MGYYGNRQYCTEICVNRESYDRRRRNLTGSGFQNKGICGKFCKTAPDSGGILAGKHVLCEKPFTTSAAQAQELYALAEEKGLFLMEGFWIRFLPVLQKMQELIKEGKLGEIRYIRSE